MKSRRQFLGSMAGLTSAGVATGLSMYSLDSLSAVQSGYKAVVVIHLNGGNDANDVLVPLDGAYGDYSKARPSIALKKDMIQAFSGAQLGHSMGLNSAMTSLMPLFNSGRLAFMVNAGALIKPTTAAEVLNGKATLPPFLFSHPEQTQYVQGWMGDEDPSGWGGRAIEAMDTQRTFKAPLISINSHEFTSVLGKMSRVVNADPNGSKFIGRADLTNGDNRWTQILESLTRFQSQTNVEAEYARTFKGAFGDAKELARADGMAQEPSGNFDNNDIAKKL